MLRIAAIVIAGLAAASSSALAAPPSPVVLFAPEGSKFQLGCDERDRPILMREGRARAKWKLLRSYRAELKRKNVRTVRAVKRLRTVRKVEKAARGVCANSSIDTLSAQMDPQLLAPGVDHPEVALRCPRLQASFDFHDFETQPVQQWSAPVNLQLTNTGNATVVISNMHLTWFNPADFSFEGPAQYPVALAPGDTLTVPIKFKPQLAAPRLAELRVVWNGCRLLAHLPKAIPHLDRASLQYTEIYTLQTVTSIRLLGEGTPPPSNFPPVRINAGGNAYTDQSGNDWLADTYFLNGDTFETGHDIAATHDDPLYQSERYGNFSYAVPLPAGDYEVVLHFAEIYWQAPNERVFNVLIEGAPLISYLDLYQAYGTYKAANKKFFIHVSDGTLNVEFISLNNWAKLSALEIYGAHGTHGSGHQYLHVVNEGTMMAVDYDGNGRELVENYGTESHTHEPGFGLVRWTWTNRGRIIGAGQEISTELPLGSHKVILTIEDSDLPPDNLSDKRIVSIYPINAVGGVLARYYPTTFEQLEQVIANPPAEPGFIETLPSFLVAPRGTLIGGSPFETNTVITMRGEITISSPGTYEFVLSGGIFTRLYLNSTLVTGPLPLQAGTYPIEARYAVSSVAALPVNLLFSRNGGAFDPLPGTLLRHSHTNLKPFINSMPLSGLPAGGTQIVISGLGFFPSSAVTVHWGAHELSGQALTVTPGSITLSTPPGEGAVPVYVETPNGTSNVKLFTYDLGAPVPVIFESETLATGVVDTNTYPYTGPTQAAWGPDGRLYVVSNAGGRIVAYTFGDNHQILNTQVIDTFNGLPNNTILGVAFNPFDPPSPVRIYVAHSRIYGFPLECPPAYSPYNGRVSMLEGPNFDQIVPVLTGLPVSNHDHGVNGLQFDDSGNLLAAIGGSTNAGIAHCGMGGQPESPLSAAVISAPVWKPGFNGNVNYVETIGGAPNNNQSDGEIVEVAAGVDVSVLVGGLRNPFDIAWTSRGLLYGTDNGPNPGLGDASTGPSSQQPIGAGSEDEILLLVEGQYYGHPNRNRGRTDYRQYIYRDPFESPLLGLSTAPLGIISASSNGITEYRSTTFSGQVKGSLFVTEWNGSLYLARLSSDGRTVTSLEQMPGIQGGLDVVTAPGGALIVVDYTQNKLQLLRPDDETASEMDARDIHPWRAPADGPARSFVIGGHGFGNLGNTTVKFGGLTATVTSVSPTRIKGIIPQPGGAAPAGLLDIEVTSAGQSSTIPDAFRYLMRPGQGKGVWRAEPEVPDALGDSSGAVLGGVAYLVGTDLSNSIGTTYAFDLALNEWTDQLPPRPCPGDGHSVEAVGGKLYVIGGRPNHIGCNPGRKVQIFDPIAGSWSFGADIPAPQRSHAGSAVIGGKILIAGGTDGSVSLSSAWSYNPASNSWSALPAMPAARNRMAYGTDGNRFYLFGGRSGAHQPSLGTDDVQVFNPATNMWSWSGTGAVPALPQRRSSLGRAPYLNGELYIIGGETVPGGQGANQNYVYDRVDAYNPGSATFRLEAPLVNARHGHTSVALDRRVFVFAGAEAAGYGESDLSESFGR